ncbi:MAG: hypothetical protein GY851_29555 [bacterium]|nr:hypothetical protein [bacterium]
MSKDSTLESLAAALKADGETAKTDGIGVKMIAEEFDRSDSWTYEMMRGEQPFPLKHFPDWVRLTGGRNLAHWIAEEAHCDLVPRDDTLDAETTVLATMREATEAVSAASKALEDGVITEKELAVYHKEMGDAIEHLRRLENLLRVLHLGGKLDDGRAATLRDA